MSPFSVLFLCTGNYYRSRFAEELFNHYAASRGLNWRAESRGLALCSLNEGPISPHTIDGLRARGIPLTASPRFPLDLQAADLESAQQVIAVKELEHRPLLAVRFPQHVGRVKFWQIHDLDCAGPATTLEELAEHVGRLLSGLS